MTDHRRRAQELLSRMSITEKVAQLGSVWLKIDEDGQESLIQTLRGAGYRLRVP